MTLTHVWGSLIILFLCPLLGGLPLIHWLTYGITGKDLRKLGTGNISVSAAFAHAGRLVGILAALSAAAKGIAAVLLARYFFPDAPVWELIALIALVMGRYWLAKGAGTTNVVWGITIHDPMTALLVFIIGGISFTILRERQTGKFGILFLLGLILSLRHPHDTEYIMAAIALCSLMAWIYRQIPDDLDVPTEQVTQPSRRMFRFFRGDKNIITLDNHLDPHDVGQKAASLAQLKEWGYPVPDGWVLPPGDDAEPLVRFLPVSEEQPLVVRSSAIGEDSESASAAGQYLSILNIINRDTLKIAITDCLASYNRPTAASYREDKQQGESAMAILVQKQIQGVFSGVAFSRDPVNQLADCVSIEALPGETTEIVSGRVTPEQYRVYLSPQHETTIEGEGNIPPDILTQVAIFSREIEQLQQGIPQDIEWSHDGERLWLLQARSITTLQPIWTRKIAAEVIPGIIHPLTWSINRPLTCGVWGEIFTLVLGKRARNLNFEETATLHFHRAYFNATLLGEIFIKMGLPPESLEFLTRGAKFTKPPLQSTLINLPGLWRLLKREWKLEKEFQRDRDEYFTPTLAEIATQPPAELSSEELLNRVDVILAVLKQATYYSILAPLSLAIRQAILQVSDRLLDNDGIPEIDSVKSLANLARETRNLVPLERISDRTCASLFTYLSEHNDTHCILERLDRWSERYGYLSQVATDIAVPRWQEDKSYIRSLFAQFLFAEPDSDEEAIENSPLDGQSEKIAESHLFNWQINLVQRRLNLKGKVNEVYSQLLAHLRWTFLALERQWLDAGRLSTSGDIFFLRLAEIKRFAEDDSADVSTQIQQLVAQRRSQMQQSERLTQVPYVVYGQPSEANFSNVTKLPTVQKLQGIGASSGIVEGTVKILLNLQQNISIDADTILVVPYTDAGWTAALTRAGGIIAEVGGKLSHGAIIAREYSIPAVMDIHHATQLLKDGQRVRIDGQQGVVEVISS